jgi:hypothetical protein
VRRYFLIDASVLIPFFLDFSEGASARSAVMKLLRMRDEERAVLLVPNFCLAECSKAFAATIKAKVKSAEKAASKYDATVEKMLGFVSSSRQGLIESHALAREHLVGVEDIFKAQWSMNPRGGEGLSGLDGLMLAMGRELMKAHGADHVRVVTGDRWMAEVCNRNPDLLPRAVDVYKDPIPDG